MKTISFPHGVEYRIVPRNSRFGEFGYVVEGLKKAFFGKRWTYICSCENRADAEATIKQMQDDVNG